jgi:hypothetical protein
MLNIDQVAGRGDGEQREAPGLMVEARGFGSLG